MNQRLQKILGIIVGTLAGIYIGLCAVQVALQIISKN